MQGKRRGPLQCKARYVMLLQALAGADSMANRLAQNALPAALLLPAPFASNVACETPSMLTAITTASIELLESTEMPSTGVAPLVRDQSTSLGSAQDPAVSLNSLSANLLAPQPSLLSASTPSVPAPFISNAQLSAASTQLSTSTPLPSPVPQPSISTIPVAASIAKGTQLVAQPHLGVLSGSSIKQQVGGLVDAAALQRVSAVVLAAAAADLPPEQQRMQHPSALRMVELLQVCCVYFAPPPLPTY